MNFKVFPDRKPFSGQCFVENLVGYPKSLIPTANKKVFYNATLHKEENEVETKCIALGVAMLVTGAGLGFATGITRFTILRKPSFLVGDMGN